MTKSPAAPPAVAPLDSAPPASAPRDSAPADPVPAHSVAADWITIWHSEWAALAADREAQEGWQRIAALWAAQANAILALQPAAVTSAIVSQVPMTQAGHDAAPRRAGSEPTPRTPAVADAPDAVIAGLLDRVADLERRANLAPDAAAGPRPRPGADRRNRRLPPPPLAARPP